MQTRAFTFHRRRSEYRLFTDGIDPSRPVGAVVRLHGDGDEEYRNPSGLLSSLASVAASHNMVLVAPLTPHRWRGRTWWRRLNPHIRWLEAFVVREVLTIPGVDPQRIWWMGYSGGAEMISYGIVPSVQDLVTGGALMLGGGGAPDALDAPLMFPGLPLTWSVGSRDNGTTSEDGFDALAAARAGSEWFRHEGFTNVSLDVHLGCDHYNLPQPRILDAALGEYTS
ncbi:MAG: hypothetical protein ACTH1D_09300 [Mycobacteriaceae bacterium]|uniref:hypothetical protein n=1 Tax=Corynebacterium sp. TaxID=1720 RepID=UPI003F9D1486